MRFFRSTRQDHRRETRGYPQAFVRGRLMSERGACSPRAVVAFSALSVVAWLRDKAGCLVGRVVTRWTTTGRQNVAMENRE